MSKQTKKQKNKEIVQAIRNTWSSLDSHLDYLDVPYKRGEPKRHHAKCVLEYAQIIKTLTDQL